MIYDWLIVGAGLSGATVARVLTDRGFKCLVIDQNDYVGGTCHDTYFNLLPVCDFGIHVFHTNNLKVWNFVNKYSEFVPYTHHAINKVGNQFYPVPISLLTLNRIYDIISVKEAKKFFEKLPFVGDDNFETKAISTIGEQLYHLFFRFYTKRQWGTEPKNLPPSIFNRIPVRYNFDTRYFSDQFQAMPTYGYTNLITNMLKNIEVKLETPFSWKIANYDRLLWTGCIDEFFDYRFGRLGYRSLNFEYIIEDEDNFGAPHINYTDNSVDYTRTATYNHFYPHIKNDKYITTRERATDEGIPLYPVPVLKNKELYKKYKEIEVDTIFLGRRANFIYENMDQAISAALELGKKL